MFLRRDLAHVVVSPLPSSQPLIVNAIAHLGGRDPSANKSVISNLKLLTLQGPLTFPRIRVSGIFGF